MAWYLKNRVMMGSYFLGSFFPFGHEMPCRVATPIVYTKAKIFHNFLTFTRSYVQFTQNFEQNFGTIELRKQNLVNSTLAPKSSWTLI